MKRNTLFTAKMGVIITCLVMTSALVLAGDPKPNIVQILVDDLGWQDVACYYKQVHGTEPLYEWSHKTRNTWDNSLLLDNGDVIFTIKDRMMVRMDR